MRRMNKERNCVVSFRASAQYVKCCLVWRNMINAVLFGATSRYVVLGCVHVGMYHMILGAQTRPRFIVHKFINLFLSLVQSALL